MTPNTKSTSDPCLREQSSFLDENRTKESDGGIILLEDCIINSAGYKDNGNKDALKEGIAAPQSTRRFKRNSSANMALLLLNPLDDALFGCIIKKSQRNSSMNITTDKTSKRENTELTDY